MVTVANAGGFNFADATTKRADGFIQDEIKLFDDQLILTPGVRYATYELDPRPNPFYSVRRGQATPQSPRAKSWSSSSARCGKVNEQISLVGRYAEGFKMPTAQQLYTSLPNGGGTNSYLIPNPDLRPESVKSYEAGIRVQGPSGFLSVTGFHADYTDFIQNFVQVPQRRQPGHLRLHLPEPVEGQHLGRRDRGRVSLPDNWTVSASVAFIDGTQVATPNALETAFDGTTPFSGTFGVRYGDPDTGFDGQLITTWASQVLERSSPTLYRPDGYVAFDAIFGWSPRWVPGLTLRASVLNFADARYFRSLNGATTYPIVPTTAVAITNPLELQTAPGRTFKVGATYTF